MEISICAIGNTKHKVVNPPLTQALLLKMPRTKYERKIVRGNVEAIITLPMQALLKEKVI
jgi:hypothetical protein